MKMMTMCVGRRSSRPLAMARNSGHLTRAFHSTPGTFHEGGGAGGGGAGGGGGEDTVVSRCKEKIRKSLNVAHVDVMASNDDPNGSHKIFRASLLYNANG
eukprot:scaffold367_cov274-Ochromonas_danica.AAC.6